MQQRLVLRCRPIRRRYRCQGLHALALARQKQARAVVAQWLGSIGVADHPLKLFHIGRKTSLTLRQPEIHSSLHMLQNESLHPTPT
jgi:hypothetical protein